MPAGLEKLGSGPYGSNAVAGVLQALKDGRGIKVDRSEAIPGDIWMDSDGNKHIGVVYEVNSNGASQILSNSSSKAKFSWLGTVESVQAYYPSNGSQFWRVTS